MALWWLRPRELAEDDDLRRTCEAWLSDEERARGARFLFAAHREEHLATRALCRAVLASYVDVAPGALAFRVSELGRPELEPPQRALSFNLTNKPELVACAVSRAGVVGVDVEPLAAADTILDVASTVFTARELLDLGALDLAARRARALRLWTAKEAYMKARGMGMTLPPRSFEVAVRAVGEGADRARTELVAVAPPHADGRRWAFEALELDGHLATVCVEASAPVEVRTRRVQLRTQPDAG